MQNCNKTEKTSLEKDMENRYAYSFKKYMLKNWFNIKDSEKHLLNENTDVNEEHAFEKLLVLAFYLNNGIVMFHGDGEASFLSCTDLLSMNDSTNEGVCETTREITCYDKTHSDNCLQGGSDCDLGGAIRSEATLEEPNLGEPNLGEPNLGEPNLEEPNLEEPNLEEPPLQGPKPEESIPEASIVNETVLDMDLKELEIFEKEIERDLESEKKKNIENLNSNHTIQVQDIDLEKELNKLVSEMS